MKASQLILVGFLFCAVFVICGTILVTAGHDEGQGMIVLGGLGAFLLFVGVLG